MTRPPDVTAWERALTQMEDELNEHEERVRLGQPVVVPAWEPPADLGPLPLPLAERTTNLVRRIGLLSTFVHYQLLAVDGDLKHLQRQAQGKGALNQGIALFLDASA